MHCEDAFRPGQRSSVNDQHDIFSHLLSKNLKGALVVNVKLTDFIIIQVCLPC